MYIMRLLLEKVENLLSRNRPNSQLGAIRVRVLGDRGWTSIPSTSQNEKHVAVFSNPKPEVKTCKRQTALEAQPKSKATRPQQ